MIPPQRDPLRLLVWLGVYVFLYIMVAVAAGWALLPLGGYLLGITMTGLLAAGFTNWLSIRMFAGLEMPALGLRLNRDSLWNGLLGLAGGMGSALFVMGLPLVLGMARVAPAPQSPATVGSFLFVAGCLLMGSSGEELLFRGYGFQVLLRGFGPWVIVPVGLLFGALHANNPSANWLGLANTVGFGILFGYAFVRSRDLWLPIGLHFGWNLTLPLFGENVSGLKMGMTGFTMEWTAGALWSGGNYGPEASVLTSAVMFLLALYLWKAAIRRQPSALLDPPAETAICESRPPQSP